MILDDIRDFLDINKAKYSHITHSAAYSDREIIRITPGLIKITPLVMNNKLAFALTSYEQTVDLDLARIKLQLKTVQLATEQRVKELLQSETNDSAGYLESIVFFAAEDILSLQNIVLYERSYTNLIQLSLQEFSELFNLKISDFFVQKKYKARIKYIAPTDAKKTLPHYEKCFIGFSMENHNFDKQKFKGVIDWVGQHFKQCSISVLDPIHRHTVQINRHIDDESVALAISKQLAQDVMREYNELLENQSNSCQFEWVLASEIQKRDDYKGYYQQLCDLLNHDTAFTNAVNDFSGLFVNRRKHHNDKQVELAMRYILEEAAVMSCYVKDGWPVFVYPGTLGIFNEFSEGKHPCVPEPLKQLIMVGLYYV